MTYTPIARGTLNWDTPLNAALTQLDNNTSSVLASSLQAVNNLSDLTNVSQARSNLGLTAMASILNNFTATAAPTTSNDGTQGYTTGSLWLNTSTSIWYRCVSNATGAAVWTMYIDGSTTQTITGAKTFTLSGPTNFTGTTTGQQIIVANGTDVTTSGFRSQVLGDTFSRWVETVDGGMAWGSGAAARDTNLYRSAAGVLKTDNSFSVGTNLLLTGGTYRNTTSTTTTVSNTVTETILASMTIPANDMVVGAVYRLRAFGLVSVASATTPTIAFHARIGGVGGGQFASSGTITAGSGVTGRPWWCDILFTCLTTGTSGSVFGQMKTDQLIASTATLPASPTTIMDGSAAQTVNTTTSQVLCLTVVWGTASTSNTALCQGFLAERVS